MNQTDKQIVKQFLEGIKRLLDSGDISNVDEFKRILDIEMIKGETYPANPAVSATWKTTTHYQIVGGTSVLYIPAEFNGNFYVHWEPADGGRAGAKVRLMINAPHEIPDSSVKMSPSTGMQKTICIGSKDIENILGAPASSSFSAVDGKSLTTYVYRNPKVSDLQILLSYDNQRQCLFEVILQQDRLKFIGK